MMKCRICDVLIDQDEADLAAEIVGEGYETMCVACAESLRKADESAVGEGGEDASAP